MKVAFLLAAVAAVVIAAPLEDFAKPKNYTPGFGQIGYQYGHTSSALKKAAYAAKKASKPSKAAPPPPAAEEPAAEAPAEEAPADGS